MTIMERKRGGSLDAIPKTERQGAIAPKPKPKAEKIKASFFLTANDHTRITELCLKNGWSQQQIFEYALHSWLVAQGEPGLESVEKREKEEAQ